jgi:hypothetical protein
LAKEKIEKTSKPIEKTKIEKAEKARHELHGIWTEQTFFLDVTNWKKWEVVPKNRTNPGYDERTRIDDVWGIQKQFKGSPRMSMLSEFAVGIELGPMLPGSQLCQTRRMLMEGRSESRKEGEG